MERLATFFILIFFAITMAGPSMFMLSLEKGRVYAEYYSPPHVIKSACPPPACSSQGNRTGCGSEPYLRHRHIQLPKDTITVQLPASFDAPVISGIPFFPPYPALDSSPGQNTSFSQLNLTRQLKLPLIRLLQSSALLI